jgi:hypothetical protein
VTGYCLRLHPKRLQAFGVFRCRRAEAAGEELDDAFPQAMEAEEEFDLLRAFDGADEFHGSFAARALERIGSPDFEDEVEP